jgi:putative ABC transport system ATP-binding protein
VTAWVDAIIAARQVTKAYGSGSARVEALRGIDLTIKPGEFVAVMGSSGSGKSTLLQLIAGLDRPTSGSIEVGGHDLGRWGDDELTLLRRRWIGVIFQAFNLLDVLSALENVALPLAITGISRAAAQERAAQALDLVGLAHRGHHLPGQLSGGEQQRVAIARALVIEPLILLADEPTGNLDSTSGARIMDLVRHLADTRRQTILMVTHDPGHAARADRLVLLRDGQVVAARSDYEAMDIHGSRGPAPARTDRPHPPGDCHWSGGVPGHRRDDSQRPSCLP